MNVKIILELGQGEVTLETAQKLVSELEGADMRILPKLSGRIILPVGAEALAKYDSCKHFYRHSKDGASWACSCKGYQFRQHYNHSEGTKNYLAQEPARSKETQIHQPKKKATIAKASQSLSYVDIPIQTGGFRPCLAGE